MSFSDMHTNTHTHTHTHTHRWAGVVSHLLDIVIKWEIAGWTYTHTGGQELFSGQGVI